MFHTLTIYQMEKLYRKSTLLFIAGLLAFSVTTFAQHDGAKHSGHKQTLKSKKLNAINFIKVTGGLGMSTYYGDICDGWDCYQFRHSFSLGIYYRYNQRFCFKLDGFWTRLSNDDRIYKNERNLGFRTDVFELAGSVMYDIFPFQHKFEQRRTVEPYVHAGIGLAYFNPKGKLDGKWHNLHELQTEGVNYSRATPVIPFGIGLRTRLRHDLNLSLEFTYRKTFTDYLDDVSGKYYKNPNDIKAFPDGPNSTAAQLADKTDFGYYPERVRGNPNKKDGYFTFNFRLEYMIEAFSDMRSKGNLNRIVTGKKTIKRR